MKNIVVVGCGYWGKNLVRNFYELGVLQGICDSNTDLLRDFAEQYPGIHTYQAYSEVLGNTELKGIVIATPAASHYTMAKEALLKDKDVFVEKPLSLRVDEGSELVAIARSKKKILMVGHILQYHSAVVKLKELIAAGDLGRLQYIYSNRLNMGKIRTEENSLWSFAPHDISVILKLLDEFPESVSAKGANYLHSQISDVTLTTMDFNSGVKSHIFVSWLHPFKEQKLVVVGDKKMAVFDDTTEEKLFLYPHRVDWVNRIPVAFKASPEVVAIGSEEPLRKECAEFVRCCKERTQPLTDGEEGLRVLKILDAFQRSMNSEGKSISCHDAVAQAKIHPSAYVDERVSLGKGTCVWHFSHILRESQVGENCRIGQNVVIGPRAVIGNNCKIQNNVSVYEGVVLEDEVFCGPSMVFTNVINPRSAVPRMNELKKTIVRRGATIGANATVVCGNVIGQFAFVGAGAVVTKEVPDYALVVGNPARISGWMCECGGKLPFNKSSKDASESVSCAVCFKQYYKQGEKVQLLAK